MKNMAKMFDELPKSQQSGDVVHDAKSVFGPALRLLRIRAGYTQQDVVVALAMEDVDITQGWLCKVETEQTSISAEHVAALCSCYQIDVSAFHSVVEALRRNRELSKEELREAFAELGFLGRKLSTNH